MKNTLFYGDNLDILRKSILDESVDLIYLDPPFNSKQTYNVLFAEKNGSKALSQIKAFEDTWYWDQHTEAVYYETVESGGMLSETLQAFRKILGTNDMMAYLVMMAPRLYELHRVLKSTGSLYLHCDPTASHYIKLLLDSIFGKRNFRNEIVWKRTSARSDSHSYNHIHDLIFFYTKSERFTFYVQYTPYTNEYIKNFYRYTEEETGRLYRVSDLMAAGTRRGSSGQVWRGVDPSERGNHWKYKIEKLDKLDKEGRIYWPQKEGGVPGYKRYLDEMPGVPLQSIWTDIPPISSHAKERLGYPTQKPEALLERIISVSSNQGGVVLDPFCGCGTSISVAERLSRQWIGIDITFLAISLIKNRLVNTFHDRAEFETIGEPVSLYDAEALAKQDPFQFQWWVMSLVSARPVEKMKGADKGIDGKIFFHDDDSGKTKTIVLSVKAGKISVAHVRDLIGVVTREKAQIGVLISLNKPTRPMVEEAASAGFYESIGWNKKYLRIQLLTINEILAGKVIDSPPQSASFKSAQYKGKSKFKEGFMF